MKLKLGIYARQSRDKGAGGSIEDQILKGKEKAKQLGLDFEVYIDKGKSAFHHNFENRPEFERLLDDIQRKVVGEVFVFDSSRLSRHEETNFLIKKLFKFHNVIVHTVSEGPTDFADTGAVLINDFKALFNMKFAIDTSLKIKSVLKNNAMNGRAPSGVIKPFGYTSDESRMLIVDEEEAKIVVEIYNLCLNGHGSSKIAKVLNERGVHTKTHRLILQKKLGQVEGSSFNNASNNRFKKWAGNTVLSILKNPLYKGRRMHKGEEFNAPAIIDKHKWEEVQIQIKKNQNAPGLSKHKYLLKNLCICGRCGSNFCGRTRPSKRDHYYYCSSRVNTKGRCGIRSINIDTLEDLIWSLIAGKGIIIDKAKEEVSKLSNPDHIQKLLQDKATYEKKINSLVRSKETILSFVNDEDITMEDARNQLIVNKNQTRDFNKLLSEIDLKLQDHDHLTRNIDFAGEFLKQWDRLVFNDDFESKRSLVKLFIDKIVIDFDDLEEIYTINVFAKLPDANNLHTLKVDVNGNFKEDEQKGGGSNGNSNNGLKSTSDRVIKLKTKAGMEVQFSKSRMNISSNNLPPKETVQHLKWYGVDNGKAYWLIRHPGHLVFLPRNGF
ncbi:recombinase family protein [Pedobacter gandavensis]|uniref:recombinase family protein n=1 Tax=Pedobacter gandavensis TaxID=2679963 RepID=UPI00292FEFFB|nr:recombinase family protein [Pedobacter gandavensis]